MSSEINKMSGLTKLFAGSTIASAAILSGMTARPYVVRDEVSIERRLDPAHHVFIEEEVKDVKLAGLVTSASWVLTILSYGADKNKKKEFTTKAENVKVES